VTPASGTVEPAAAPPAGPATATADREALLAGLAMMVRIRSFEDRVQREFARGDMPGFVHTYHGAEAVATGVCAHLNDDDLITSTHRGHGHCIAKGCDLDGMVAELYGRETGLCAGRGGSMHIADFSRGMLGANAIVGGGIALATGAALAAEVLGDGRVAVAFFGDGAANQGVLHESLNLAAIWRLPVIYVCENNGWAESTPVSYSASVADISTRAGAYGISGVTVAGEDYEAALSAGQRIARSYRNMVDPIATVGTPERQLIEALERALLLSGTYGLTETQRDAYLAVVAQTVRDTVAAIHPPSRQRITLTSRSDSIPMLIRNSLGHDVIVQLDFKSDKLDFPNGDSLLWRLAPGVNQVQVPVQAKTSGDAVLEISVNSPTGLLALGETQLTVRTTSLPGAGVAIAAAALAILMLWWARSWWQRHRSKSTSPRKLSRQ